MTKNQLSVHAWDADVPIMPPFVAVRVIGAHMSTILAASLSYSPQ